MCLAEWDKWYISIWNRNYWLDQTVRIQPSEWSSVYSSLWCSRCWWWCPFIRAVLAKSVWLYGERNIRKKKHEGEKESYDDIKHTIWIEVKRQHAKRYNLFVLRHKILLLWQSIHKRNITIWDTLYRPNTT
jgi:hypothetical protein